MKPWLIKLLLAAIVFAVFLPVLGNGFVSWDDPENFYQNPRFSPPTVEAVFHYWSHPQAGLYVPLTYTLWWSLALLAHQGEGMSALPFHLTSIFLHALSTVVVYAIVSRLVDRSLPAIVAALLFAVHPVQVETVAWASGAKDLLGGLFGLLAVLNYIAFAQSPPRSRRARTHYVLAVVALVLGMLSKPNVVIVPLIAVAIDLLILRRSARLVTRSALLLFVLVVPCIVWSRAAQTVWPQTITPIPARPLVAADALAFYLYKIAFPVSLTHLYGRTPAAIAESGQMYWTWILPAIAAVAILLLRKRNPHMLAGGALFVAALLPVLGFTPFMFQLYSTVADHYLYLPMLGVAIAVAGFLARRSSRIAYVLCGVALLALATRTMFQTRVWKDSIALFSNAVHVTPHNPQAHSGLGMALYAAGEVRQSIPHFEFLVQSVPTSLRARVELIRALNDAGRYELAISHARAAMLLDEANPQRDAIWVYLLLSDALVGVGRTDEAERHLSAALERFPDAPALIRKRDLLRRQLDSTPTTQ